jgi:antirestriction protein ArdC
MTKTQTKNTAESLFAHVTRTVIDQIEAGAEKWEMPWQRIASAHRSVDGYLYRGFNALWLPLVAAERGYVSTTWGTYNAWKKHDVQVRKGESGTKVVLWKPTKGRKLDVATGEEVENSYLYATTYTVFNAEQCDGADEWTTPPADLNSDERLAAADEFWKAWPVPITEGGDRAYYAPVADEIRVPSFGQFDSAADFYSTVAHEGVHSTGHESRLDRTFGKRFGDEAYAMEELVAELGAAFWCSQAGVSQAPRPDHASYLSHWLKVLREDPKALLTVTSKAQAAVDLLTSTVAEIAEVAA